MTKCQHQQCKRVLNTRVERIKQTKWKSNKINTHKLLIVSCLAHSSGLHSDVTLHENVLYNIIQQF